MELRTVKFKNFFSYGNAFTEIDLQKYSKSVLTGTNGMGKSTINNAITFALFGKTIKSVTKGQIVNSVNSKHCVVELILGVNNKEYRIVRGIKPNVFEIYEDGVLVDQQLVSDYQEYLESRILKCSYRTFIQTSIISIENYTPFMSLKAADRRSFIEDILDIRVFGAMNQIVKASATKLASEIKVADMEFTSAKERAMMQKKHIEKLDEIRQQGVDGIDARISDLLVSSSADSEKVAELSGKLVELKKTLATERQKKERYDFLMSKVSDLTRKLEDHEDTEESLTNLADSVCPTCHQNVLESHIDHLIGHHTQTREKLNQDRAEALEDAFKFRDHKVSSVTMEIDEIESEITRLEHSISVAKKYIANLGKEKEAALKASPTDGMKIELKEMAKEILTTKDKIAEMRETQEYNKVMLEMFKDSGIKSKIIEQYIPIINKLVNEYLAKMEFFVSFNLDSEFNETIKSRHRDTFTYASFSAGEKQRIDMALMFTFRQLAKMRNSFSCNFLAMDELFDASTDEDGVQCLINILCSSEFDNTHMMVISHKSKDSLEDFFDGYYHVYKRDGFSQIKDNNDSC